MRKYVIPLLIFHVSSLFAQQDDYGGIAKRIVNESLFIKSGELVHIYGGIHSAPLVESVVTECNKIGADVFSVITSDKEAPTINQNKKTAHTAGLPQVLIIIHPLVEDDQTVFKGLSDEEIVEMNINRSNAGAAKKSVRTLHITYPTPSIAERLKVDYNEYKLMILKSLSFDYSIQNNNINRLKQFLANSNQVRITTEEGTNFSFLVNKRPIIVSDGRITKEDALTTSPFSKKDQIPAGMLEVSILETSAIGHVVVPRAECNFEPMTDVSFDFIKGKVQNFKAKNGADCFTNRLAQHSGPKDMIGSISFGFNTELNSIEKNGGLFWPKEGVAILWLTIGSNQLLGGKNPSSCGQFSFPIVAATVEMDGKVVLKTVKH